MGLNQNLEEATDAFKQITDKMWFLLPKINLHDNDVINLFIKSVVTSQYKDFITTCDENYSKINYLAGSIRGYLLSSFVHFNLFSYINFISIKRKLTEMMKEFHLQAKKKSSHH